MKIPDSQEFVPLVTKIPVQSTGNHDKQITKADLSSDQATAVEEVLNLLDWKKKTVANVYKKRSSIISLGGVAGSGKSTLIPIISRELGSVDCTAFCALAGKAANVLQRKLAAARVHDYGFVGTIHRLIYKPLTNDKGKIIGWQKKPPPLFVETETGEFRRIRLIIVDEASMVGERLLHDLLEYEVPLLLVGDHGQLAPVQDKSIISVPDVKLEQIHRQAAHNPIIRLSALIREHGDIPKDFPPSKEIQFCTQDNLYEVIGETYERLGLNMAVLTRRNVVRKELNTLPREVPEPLVGDHIICLKNSPPIYNGMRGTIESIEPYMRHWYKATVVFPDDGLKMTGLLNAYQFGRDHTIESSMDLSMEVRFPTGAPLGLLFDFGMALTAHKAQGSQFEEVILLKEKWGSDDPEDYKRWLYTSVTRAVNKITIC